MKERAIISRTHILTKKKFIIKNKEKIVHLCEHVLFFSQVLPVLAKLSPISNACLYAYGNEFYRGGIWEFLTGQRQAEKKK